VFGKGLQAGGEVPRQQAIVGIHKDDKVSATALQPAVSCRCRTRVLLPDVLDAGVGRRHGGRLVRRAVVYDDDFVNRMPLGKDTVERLAEKPALVVTRNNDADPGLIQRVQRHGKIVTAGCQWELSGKAEGGGREELSISS
jgi:hypothetical protein